MRNLSGRKPENLDLIERKAIISPISISLNMYKFNQTSQFECTRGGIFAFALFMPMMLTMLAKAQSGTDNDPFISYYSQTRNCVRSSAYPTDASGLSKGWSYECIAQDGVVFVLSLIDRCPSIALNTVKRVSPDKKKLDIICVFLAADVHGSEKVLKKAATVPPQEDFSSIPAYGLDGCPTGRSRRIKKGFLGMGKRDYGCLTDYEYADIQAKENATEAAIMQNTLNNIQMNSPTYCYGTGFTSGSYGLTQTFVNTSCF